MEQNAQAQAKPIKIPGPEHPISVERNYSRVVVSVAGRVIADTSEALTLYEAHYPAVQYIPRKDVDMTQLTRSDRTTYCPYKGDAAILQHPRGRRALDRCGVELRDALCARRQHQGSPCILPRSGRCGRNTVMTNLAGGVSKSMSTFPLDTEQ
jgi:hypothetical protein